MADEGKIENSAIGTAQKVELLHWAGLTTELKLRESLLDVKLKTLPNQNDLVQQVLRVDLRRARAKLSSSLSA